MRQHHPTGPSLHTGLRDTEITLFLFVTGKWVAKIPASGYETRKQGAVLGIHHLVITVKINVPGAKVIARAGKYAENQRTQPP